MLLPKVIELNEAELVPGEAKFLHRRTFPAVMQTFRQKMTNDPHKFFLAELLHYRPHRDEAELFPDDIGACLDLYQEPVGPEGKTKVQFVKEQVSEHLESVIESRMQVEETLKLLRAEELLGDAGRRLDPTGEQDNEDCNTEEVDDPTFAFVNPDFLDLPPEGSPKEPVYEKMFKPVVIENNLVELTRRMDKDQMLVLNKIIEYCYALVQTANFNTPRPTPPRLMVHGGAGAGKSSVIAVISMWVQKILQKPGDDPLHPYVLKVAPTGAAANIIDGLTLHSAFSFNFGTAFNSLNPAKRHIMSQVLENVAVVIVDEVSMVTADQLAHIHMRMNEVKSRSGPTVFFGDCAVILVGDLMQLPPVLGSYVFQAPYNTALSDESTGTLFSLFDVINLTFNHRQGDVGRYAAVLNNIRVNLQTTEDLDLLRSRVVAEDAEEVQNITYIMATRARVRAVNDMRLAGMADVPETIIPAEYFLTTNVGGSFKPRIKDGMVNDTGFMDRLVIKKGCRVMLITNLDTSDWLTNGTRGTLVDILYDSNGKPDILMLKADNPKSGTQARLNNPQLARRYPDCTPIKKFSLSFALAKSKVSSGLKNTNATLKQFPLVVSFAATAHKFQGQSIARPEKIAIDLREVFTAGQAYVMLSRVESVDQLYILGDFNPAKIYAKPLALTQKKKMDAKALNLEPLWKSVEGDTLTLAAFNIRSLRNSLEDVVADEVLKQQDILCFSETWLHPGEEIHLPGFTAAHNSVGRGKGVSVYWSSAKFQAALEVEHASCPTCQITKISLDHLDILSVYRSADDQHLHGLLLGLLTAGRTTLIVGDFNLRFNTGDRWNNETLAELSSRGFQQHITWPTFLRGNILDHVYLMGELDIEVKKHQPFYSDHCANLVRLSF